MANNAYELPQDDDKESPPKNSTFTFEDAQVEAVKAKQEADENYI